VPVAAWDTLHSRSLAGTGCEEQPDLGEHFTTAWAQDAVGTDFDAPSWQHMLERIFPPDFGEMRAISEGYLNSYFIL
jgi:hypothetical protein